MKGKKLVLGFISSFCAGTVAVPMVFAAGEPAGMREEFVPAEILGHIQEGIRRTKESLMKGKPPEAGLAPRRVAAGPTSAVNPPSGDSTDGWKRNFACSPSPETGCRGLLPIRDEMDSRIGLLTNGEASFAARVRTLLNAKQSIRIQALIFKNDEAGRHIADILKAKKRDGLDVRIIVDAFSNLDLRTQAMYYDLKQNNIEVEGYEAGLLEWLNEVTPMEHLDPRQPDKRFHDKMWVMDAEDPANAVAIVGGMNIANEYFRTGSDAAHVWRDQDFIVKGKIVDDVAAVFDRNYEDQKKIKRSRPGLLNTDRAWALWRERVVAKFGKPDLNSLYEIDAVAEANIQKIVERSAAMQVETAPAEARFIQSRPRYQESYIRQAYEDLFGKARRELLVVNAYFIPGDGISAALKNAARHGAVVTVITNSPQTNDLPQMQYAARYMYKDLLSVNDDPETRESGGSMVIAEWVGNKFGEGTIHAKFAVADRHWTIGGSYNLDPRSEDLNSETVLEFESEKLSSDLARQVIEQDIPKCEIITRRQADEFHDPKHPPDWLQLQLWNGIKGEL